MRRRPEILTLTDSRDDEFQLTDQSGLLLAPPLNEDAVRCCRYRTPRLHRAGSRCRAAADMTHSPVAL